MKIGFVLDDTLDRPDGIQQYVLTLGRWLERQGHEVHYLVGETKRTDIKRAHSLSRNLEVRFNRNKLSTPLPADKNAVSKLLEAEQFDVLHVQMPFSPFLAGRIIKLLPAQTALVGTFHVAPYSALQTFTSRLLKMFQRRDLNRFDGILSVSEPAKAFAKRSFGLKSAILPNVVDIAHFQKAVVSKVPSKLKQIVFLGRLVERKGCSYLLSGLAKCQSSNWQLAIAGDGHLRSKLEAYCRTHGLTDRVKFLGFISEEQKPELLANADIAVFPSTGGESFGIVLIEAMAAGASVVLGGNNPGYETVLGDCPQALFDPKDTTQIALKLEQFLTDSKLSESVNKCQQELVKRYSVENVGPAIVKVYESAIAKRAVK